MKIFCISVKPAFYDQVLGKNGSNVPARILRERAAAGSSKKSGAAGDITLCFHVIFRVFFRVITAEDQPVGFF